MIKFDCTKDITATKVVNWCKKNGYDYNIEIKDEERSKVMYPFNIEAPEIMLSDLQKAVEVSQ